MHRNRFQQQFRNEGIIGYVLKKPIHGSIPLYRLYNPRYNSYLLTTSHNEADKMAIDYPPEPESPEGYLPTNSNNNNNNNNNSVNSLKIGNCVLTTSNNKLIINFPNGKKLELDENCCTPSCGIPGPQGPIGPQGLEGSQGPSGHKGEPGLQGPEGLHGEQGPSGNDGNSPNSLAIFKTFKTVQQLLNSNDVPQGYMGLVVTTDKSHKDNGAMYLMTKDGWEFVGDIVTEGIQGPSGPQGPQGPQGQKGDVGPTGESSTSLSITGTFDSKNQFDDSHHPDGQIVLIKDSNELLIRNGEKVHSFGELSIDVLQGPKGEVGPEGKSGPTGERGQQGEQGDDGLAGPSGPHGPQGPQGLQGLNGSDGQQGSKGEVGNSGSPGEIGPMGPIGPQGPQGTQGTQGTQGPQGYPGTSGNGSGMSVYPDIARLESSSASPGDLAVCQNKLMQYSGSKWDEVASFLDQNVITDIQRATTNLVGDWKWVDDTTKLQLQYNGNVIAEFQA